jgi:predicted HAD superfamily Cof-like phosphohydrolase
MHSKERAELLVEEIQDHNTRRLALASLRQDADMNLMVKAFHAVYDLPVLSPRVIRPYLGHISKERLAMRFGLIVEEFMELCEAMDIRADINFFYHDEERYVAAAGKVLTAEDHDSLSEDEHSVIVRERCKEAIVNTEERRIVDIADATFDLKYVLIGFEYEVGIDPQFCANEGQASNMSKLNTDGTVIKREDGKVMKGPHYFKPDMSNPLRAWGAQL